MTTLFFLVMAALCAGIYIWKQRAIARGNRYRAQQREPQKVEPQVVAFPASTDRDPLIESTRSTLSKAAAIHDAYPHTPTKKPDHFIVFYLMAPEEALYAGYELLQALLSAGLRFGKQHLFHRHVHKDGRGETLFHCAQAVRSC